MSTLSLPQMKSPSATPAPRIALVGNPNVGKSFLFNRLTGLHTKVSNFAGTTVEYKSAPLRLHDRDAELVDLPGVYALAEDPEDHKVTFHALTGQLADAPQPDAVLLVLDATQLQRQLYLASQVRELGRPTLVALNLIDQAREEGTEIDLACIEAALHAPVIAVSARTGEGIEELKKHLKEMLNRDDLAVQEPPVLCGSCNGCVDQGRYEWADRLCGQAVREGHAMSAERSDKLDRVLAHPYFGMTIFAVLMAGLFMLLFKTATYPMDWIEIAFGWLGDTAADVLPDGQFESFVVDGIIGGVGGVLVFLPQICILFFAIALLEDSGYLARAAFVMDRWMKPAGLPGKAFVPMLAAHACAIPAIMSTRVIETKRDRMLAILVIPLMTCSARLPVYAMITALLFADRPLVGGLAFFGCYVLGIAVALGLAFAFGKTVLPGKPQDLFIELPRYRLPALSQALRITWERGLVFVKQAGTVILGISIVLWFASTYPQLPEDRVASVAEVADQTRLVELEAALEATPEDEDLAGEYDNLISEYQLRHSAAGRMGTLFEPVFEPLGFTWQMNIGVVTSFAAREVFVSSLAVVYGVGEDGAEDGRLLSVLQRQTRPDGTPVFSLAAGLSVLVFYVLAMQCLPTLAVTKRETGSWGWAALQFVSMTLIAYVFALVTYQGVSLLS